MRGGGRYWEEEEKRICRLCRGGGRHVGARMGGLYGVGRREGGWHGDGRGGS